MAIRSEEFQKRAKIEQAIATALAEAYPKHNQQRFGRERMYAKFGGDVASSLPRSKNIVPYDLSRDIRVESIARSW